MMAVFAQLDNDMRTLRTTTGMKARTEQGGWPHDAPFGYTKVRLPSGITSIEPNQDASKIKKLLHEFSKGFITVSQATELAYELGIKTRTGGRRSWQSIKNILSDVKYAGYVKSKFTAGELVRGVHVGIIDEATYYRVQALLNGPTRNYGINMDLDYPLRGSFMRHTCGYAMTGSAPKGSTGPSPRYSCPKCRASIIKVPVSAKREVVHKHFTELLKSIVPKPAIMTLFREVVVSEWNREFKDALDSSRLISNEMELLQRRKSRVLDLWIDEKISEEDNQKKMKEISEAMAQLELKRLDSDKYIKDKEAVIDGAMLFMADPALFWDSADSGLKKHIQFLIFPEGLMYDCTKGYRTPVLSNSYLLINKIARKGDVDPNVVVLAHAKTNTVIPELPPADRSPKQPLIRHRLPESLQKRIVELYASGMSMQQVALSADVSKGSVVNVLHRAGVPIRTPRGRGQTLASCDQRSTTSTPKDLVMVKLEAHE